MYRGTKDETIIEQHPVKKKIKMLERASRSSHKISLTKVFKRGFGRIKTKFSAKTEKSNSVGKQVKQLSPDTALPNENSSFKFSTFRRYLIDNDQGSGGEQKQKKNTTNLVNMLNSEDVVFEATDTANYTTSLKPKSSIMNQEKIGKLKNSLTRNRESRSIIDPYPLIKDEKPHSSVKNHINSNNLREKQELKNTRINKCNTISNVEKICPDDLELGSSNNLKKSKLVTWPETAWLEKECVSLPEVNNTIKNPPKRNECTKSSSRNEVCLKISMKPGDFS